MDKHIETIRSCGRKKQLTHLELVELTTACNEAARHYTALIEDGSSNEGSKVRFLRDEAQRVYETVLTQKQPQLPEDLVRKLEQAVETLSAVAVKEPTKKKLNFPSAHDTSEVIGGDPQPQPTAAEEDDDNDEEESELDSEEEFLASVERERVASMGTAAWHMRAVHICTLSILILACVGVIFVSSRQYDDALFIERKDSLSKQLNIVLSALDVIDTLSPPDATVKWSTAFVDEVAALRLKPNAPPFLTRDDDYVWEMLAVRYRTELLSGERNFDRIGLRKFSLLCTQDVMSTAVQPNDLTYGPNRTTSVLWSANCNTQTTGASMWRDMGTGFVTIMKMASYKRSMTLRAAKQHAASGLGVMVQTDLETLQELITPPASIAGVVNPLPHVWQQKTALWAAFAVAIGFLCFIAAAELCMWMSKEERLSDALSIAVYALLTSVVSLIVVVSVASISWTFLSDALDEARLRELNTQARIVAAAAATNTLSVLAPNGAAVDVFISGVSAGPLKNAMFSYDRLQSADAAMRPNDALTQRINAQAQVTRLLTSGLWYASRAQKIASRTMLLTSAALIQLPISVVPAMTRLLCVFREVDMTNIILDAGSRSAGPVMGVLGAQLVFIAVYMMLTPLRLLWPYAAGAVWVEQLVKPCNFRRIHYAVVSGVSFAVCLALAFSCVSALTGRNEMYSQNTDKIAANALASLSSRLPRGWLLQDFLPSFGDALIFDLAQPLYKNQDGVPHLFAGADGRCAHKFPILAWSPWEANYYGAALALQNVTTTVRAPSYYTPMVTPDFASVDPPSVIYSQLTTAPISGTSGLVFERSLESVEMVPQIAYRVYVSFVLAALLSSLMACAVYELLYRRAESDRDMTGNETPRYLWWAMTLVLVVPAFSPIIAAGGSAQPVRDSLELFAFDELRWQVGTVASGLEKIAMAESAVGTSATVVATLTNAVVALNARRPSQALYARWALLVETSNYDLRTVTSFGDEDFAITFTMEDLAAAASTPVIGTISSSKFSASESLRDLTYAMMEVPTGVSRLRSKQPVLYVLLAMDLRQARAGDDEVVLEQLYKVAGTCVFMLCAVFWMSHWYTISLCDAQEYPLQDETDVFPALAHNEANEFIAPPVMSRQLRFAHAASLLVFLALLVYFTASVTFGAQSVRLAVEHPTQTLAQGSQLRNDMVVGITSYFNYLITSLRAPLVAATAFASGLSHATLGDEPLLNASTGTVLMSAAASMGSVVRSVASEPTFDTEDLVLSFQETYHAATMRLLNPTESKFVDVWYPLNSALGQLQVLTTTIAESGVYNSQFNASALVSAMYYVNAIVDTMTKVQTLERIAVSTFLDFSDTPDTSAAFSLQDNATQVISVVRTAHAHLWSKVEHQIASAMDFTSAAFGDAEVVAGVVEALSRTASQMRKVDSLSHPQDALWAMQKKRIAELQEALHGGTSAIAGVMASASASMLTLIRKVESALSHEVHGRVLRDFNIGRRTGSSYATTAVQWASLRKWPVWERIRTIRDVRDFYATAAAVTVLALVLGALIWAAMSVVSFDSAVRRSHLMALDASVSLRRPAVDDDDEDDLLLEKTAERHHAAHRRRLLIVAMTLAAVSIPVGMAYWTAEEGRSRAHELVLDGSDAVRARSCLDMLPSALSDVLLATSRSYTTGDIAVVAPYITRLKGLLNVAIDSLSRPKRKLLRELRDLEAAGVSIADSRNPSDFFHASRLRVELQQFEDFVEAVRVNFTTELDLYVAMRSVTTNISSVLLSLQKVAAVPALALVTASTPEEWERILCPVSPVTVRSELENYTTTVYNVMLSRAAAVSTSNATAVREFCSIAAQFPKILFDAVLAPINVLDTWTLFTDGTRRNNSFTVRDRGNYSAVSATGLSQTTLPANVQAETAALFADIVAVMSPYPAAPDALFSNTAPFPSAYNFTGQSYGVWIQAAAAASSYFRSTPQPATFRQLYAFNRGLFTKDQLALNTEYTQPLFELMDSLGPKLAALIQHAVDEEDFPPLSNVNVNRATDSISRALVSLARRSSTTYGLHNPEYVSVAVEWCCTVAFWLLLAACTFLVIDLRLLHL